MRIEHYFQQIQEDVEASQLVDVSSLVFEQRGESLGFIRGELTLIDNSVLHVREFVDTSSGIFRDTYAYHYMDSSLQFVFRYDNAAHYPNLSTHPHHKHEGSEENVVESSAPTLADVLEEVELLVRTA